MYVTVNIESENMKLLPFNGVVIEMLEITKGVNKHTKLKITGTMSKDNSVTSLSDEIITLIANIDGEELILFRGTALNSKFDLISEEYKFELICATSSIEMDIFKQSRLFQSCETYSDIVNVIKLEYDISCGYKSENRAINPEIFQDDETDWQFLKRLASRLEDGLYNVLVNGEYKLIFGLPSINNNVIVDESIDEIYSNDVSQDYIEDGSNLVKSRVFKVIDYVVTSSKVLELGEVVTCRDMECYVKAANTKLIEGVIVTQYLLTTRNGMKRSILND